MILTQRFCDYKSFVQKNIKKTKFKIKKTKFKFKIVFK